MVHWPVPRRRVPLYCLETGDALMSDTNSLLEPYSILLSQGSLHTAVLKDRSLGLRL
jgi:hypothetical protein